MEADQVVPRYTYNDYAQWEGAWELIDGYPYAKSPSPRMKHQLVGTTILQHLKEALSNNSLCRCRVVYELDWIINDSTVLRPDIMVICGAIEGDFLR